jgi:hypothetical protein
MPMAITFIGVTGFQTKVAQTVTKFKLADSATQVLGSRLPVDAPRILRLMFSRAVETQEMSPRLRIEKVGTESAVACTA